MSSVSSPTRFRTLLTPPKAALMRQWWSGEDRRKARTWIQFFILVGFALAIWPGAFAAWTVAGRPAASELSQAVGVRSLLVWLLVGVLLLVPWVLASRWLWYWLAPTGTGFATKKEVAANLSEAAARRKAPVTRPSLSEQACKSSPVGEVGIPLHRSAWGTSMYVPHENPTGVLAPTQSGKSLAYLIHPILHAPGACLVTSTKLDLFRLTALWRERATAEGLVAVLDLTGTTGWPYQIRWDPRTGCTDWRTATRRAKALVAGTRAKDDEGSGGSHKFFERRGSEALAAYLQAAAVADAPLDRFLAWCQDPDNTEAAEILDATPGCEGHGRSLQKQQGLVDQTRDGVWETIRDAISCLVDPVTRDMCVVGDDAGFDVKKFLEEKGTVYILGSERAAADLAPFVTAFVEHVLFEASQIALGQGTLDGRERLDPPLTVVLDEVCNICPLPSIPEELSDSAGRGIIIHWAAQSRPQLVKAFGDEGCEMMLDNTTALTVFGALKSKSTLEWLSTLCDKRIEERQSRQSNPLQLHLTRQIGQERTEVLTPGQIRGLPPGRVLVLFRTLRPVIALTVKAWEMHEWEALQADRKTVIGRAAKAVTDGVTDEIAESRHAAVGELDDDEEEAA